MFLVDQLLHRSKPRTIVSSAAFHTKRSSAAGVSALRLAAYERFVLQVLDWRLCAAPPCSFADAFCAKGLWTDEDTIGPEHDVAPTAEGQQRVFENAKFFCNMATLHGLSCTYGDSVSAASSVAAARAVHSIRPVWPQQLGLRLGHDYVEINLCLQALLQIYSAVHAREVPDAVPELVEEELHDRVGSLLQAQLNTTDAVPCLDVDAAASSLSVTPTETAGGDDDNLGPSSTAHESPTNIDLVSSWHRSGIEKEQEVTERDAVASKRRRH